MIVQSGNDATVALAELISGNEPSFAQLMNETAKKLGMTNTHFENATGLNHPNHYSTASDLARLAAAIIHEYPEFYPIYSTKSFTYQKITQPNRNLLLYRDSSVSVVMGTKSDLARAQESQKLLNFGFGAYESTQFLGANQRLQTAPVYKGELSTVYVGSAQPLWMTLPNGESHNVTRQITVNAPLVAPLAKGQEVGKITLLMGGKPVQTFPLVTLEAVSQGGIFKRLKDTLRLSWEKH
jgi:serine-type D-Ala-D-Ala carboxypeptidase (penicillin-binding protein 5/6)